MHAKPDRELQVLDAAARGLTIAETGAELFIGANTVKTYRKRILARYGARSMTQAVALWTAERAPADLGSEVAGAH